VVVAYCWWWWWWERIDVARPQLYMLVRQWPWPWPEVVEQWWWATRYRKFWLPDSRVTIIKIAFLSTAWIGQATQIICQVQVVLRILKYVNTDTPVWMNWDFAIHLDCDCLLS